MFVVLLTFDGGKNSSAFLGFVGANDGPELAAYSLERVLSILWCYGTNET